MKRPAVGSWAGIFFLLGGCLPTRELAIPQASTPHYQVKCSGECVELKNRTASNKDALLRKVEELLKEQRFASIDNLVERHAETVIRILQERDSKRPASEAEIKLAGSVDRLFQPPSGDGWQDRLQGRGRGGLDRAENTLRDARNFACDQKWHKTLALLQKNRAAAAPFSYPAILTDMVLAEAHRNLGDAKASSQAWQDAVVRAAHLHQHLQVPDLWEQLAANRPVSSPWPSDVAAAMPTHLPPPLQELSKESAFVPEAFVWFRIGQARLNRAEASEALTAFKRADSQGKFPHWDDFLALYQAKALLAMQQTPAATSLLTTLVSRAPSSPWRLPALGLLGSGKLQEGHTLQALKFLSEAVSSSPSDFTWRADAEANLGLAYLMTASEEKGLKSLHNAQERFAADRNWPGLLQCLENEAAYLEKMGGSEEPRRIRRRITECESRTD